MPKYLVKFRASAVCWKVIQIKNEENPLTLYKETETLGENLEEKDFVIDNVSIESINPAS